MWYEDLSSCGYFGPECAACLRAVGWLERGRPFPTGPVDAEVYRRLIEMSKHPWQPSISLGFHRCDLCLYEGQSGNHNVFVPAGEVIFV